MSSKTKAFILITGISLLLIGYIVFLNNSLKEKKEAIQTLENNNEQLLTGTRILETENGKLVYKVNEVTVTSAELALTNSGLSEELKNAKVKVKNLESLINLSISSKDTVTINTRDTLIQNLPFKTFNYNTKWYQVKGIQDNSTIKLDIGCYHDISIANETIYKGWWIFKKLLKTEVTVIVSNPKDSVQKIQSFYISEKRRRKVSN